MNFSFILYSNHAIVLKIQLRRRDITTQHVKEERMNVRKECLTIDSVMRSTSTASSTTSCGQKALQGGNRKRKKPVTNVCVSVSSYIGQSVTELSGLTAILKVVLFF